MITIVGLGIERDDLTLGALEALTSGSQVLLRTARTPAADVLRERGVAFSSLDALYEEMEDYDEVNDAIVRAVLEAAKAGDVVFGVLGGGGLLDTSVRAVCAAAEREGVQTRVVPGVGLYERAAGAAGGLDGACVLAAIDLAEAVLDVRRPLLVCEFADRCVASDAKLVLLDHYPASWQVLWNGAAIALEDLDRQKSYDHKSVLVVPQLSLLQAERYDFSHLEEIVRRLRAPGGCPWDREQTHASMKADLIEEAYEVLDAIDGEDPDRLADELGDLLLHVVMHACIGEEHGEFSMQDVLDFICHKMILRHPHVFGEVQVDSSEEVLRNWEEIKKGEKSLHTQTEVMRDVPRTFPALMRAAKVQKKARDVGFDWDDVREALKKVREEADEVEEVLSDPEALPGELGDLLFAAVNVCRMKKVPPELALQATTEKFIRRFSHIEEAASTQGRSLRDMTLREMDALWEEAKGFEHKK
ncbi:MAG: nucleoside triphosphate pyrophosphohydrolase [Candidatus Spyradocola sp.]|jgi:tetrapyrrole methylase family protein/MazG family protein